MGYIAIRVLSDISMLSSTDDKFFKDGFLFGPGCTPTCITHTEKY